MTIPADLQNKLKPVTDIYIPKRKFDIAIDILDSIKKEYSHFDLVDYYIAMCHINLSEFKDAVLIFERFEEFQTAFDCASDSDQYVAGRCLHRAEGTH